jgi:hypothetical protein
VIVGDATQSCQEVPQACRAIHDARRALRCAIPAAAVIILFTSGLPNLPRLDHGWQINSLKQRCEFQIRVFEFILVQNT